uniref:Uncharacterized protein n=1 Tax=Anopheles coluzzii TaxID=1518534 RepID=A0A8W7PST6_ANOCL
MPPPLSSSSAGAAAPKSPSQRPAKAGSGKRTAGEEATPAATTSTTATSSSSTSGGGGGGGTTSGTATTGGHGHQHSTISSSIRKELASYENPYQTQAGTAGGGGMVRKKPTKRNASTESLDLFDSSCPPEECSCGLYSPSSINGGKGCRKCASACDTTGTTKSAQQQQKKHNSSKFKDASTSPKSSSPLKAIGQQQQECRSPKIEASTDTKFDFNFSPKTESHYRRLSSLSINSSGGHKHAVTASPMKQAAAAGGGGGAATLAASSAATSPKLSPQKLTPVRAADHQRTLEKSNSLGESKPPRMLRNTRSLSPRPPVRHQHSIMVSDENDIISVKLSPNEEYCDDEGTKRRDSAKKAEPKDEQRRVAAESKGDSSTPKSNTAAAVNGGGGGGGEKAKKLSDCLKSANNNRSTSCLVYVPSDPWTRMSASNSPLPSLPKQQKSKTLDNSAKAYGKPCLDYMKHSDPWVWRSNVNLPERGSAKGGTGGGAKKRNAAALPHQTKSLTSTVSRDDSDVAVGGKHQAKLCQQQSLGRFEKTLTIPGVDGSFDARKKITRPKLQRSKSPSFYEDFFQPPPAGAGETDTNKSPQTGFSTTPSQKDDELQLNIRRLSEQMNKYSHSAAFPTPPAFLNDTILQQQVGASKKVGGSGGSLTAGPTTTAASTTAGGSIGGLNEATQRKTASHSKINEPILETRC